MEGVFSSSMYVSSIQMCKSEPPKAGHLLFISPLEELAVGHFHWAENGGTGRYQVITGCSTPSVRCRGWPRVLLESRESVSHGYLRNTGRSVGPHRTCPILNGLKLREVSKFLVSADAEHRTVRCSLDLNPAERFVKPHGHQTQNIGRSNLRPVPGVRCLTLAEVGSLYTRRTDTTFGASGPASGECFLSEKHSRDFSKFSTGAIENIHLIFSKACVLTPTSVHHTPLNPRNSSSFVKCANTKKCPPPKCMCVSFSHWRNRKYTLNFLKGMCVNTNKCPSHPSQP